ncbi:MAG TPA: thiamine pyrophosphate-dependent dehydrogenase E1 component subunit alpha [Chloroflexota bacterium]|jgi:TPP-dependent pyruvate/acetoin dehydrogenase alpha subunit|nr:thiamine pyrophosphate-dependent dehydrogenase E1 component subunit alpha [Chloroflexota bacterium]
MATAVAAEPRSLLRRDLVAMYYFMQLTRSLEDRVRNLYLQGKLVGAVYRSMGQEGTAVASAYALEEGDYIAPLIRDLGASIVRGVPLDRIFAQWLGRVAGPSGGRDGNLHFGYMERGVLAPVSMLGATIPLCAGVALAAKQLGRQCVALAYIGDGGTNTGDFHEGLNFAATLRLPVILLVENNGYAYSTPTHKQFAIRDLATRARAYGIPGEIVDGNDVEAVYTVTRRAAERARAGEGPTLIEAKTFRMRGHAEHDDASYVPKELFDAWSEKDPIKRLDGRLTQADLWQPGEKDVIEARIRQELDDAVAAAESSEVPDGTTQQDRVYASVV